MSSLAIWAQTHIRRHTLQLVQGFSLLNTFPTITMDFDMTAFLQNETCGFKKFEEVLTDDVYCTVPEALAQTYGVVCSPSLAMNEEGVPAVVPPVQVSDTVMFLTKVGYLKCMYIS